VGAVHFTGSTSVGRSIAQAVASRFVPYSLEMGGSNPAIVFDDADVELAADCIADTVGALQGQKCTTTRRVIVHERLAPALIERLRARFEAFVPGDPADPCTTLGPLISPEAAAQARRVVERSIALGARVLAQTPMAGVGDCFFPATLLGALAEHDPLNREELFAPVVAVSTFIADEQAWARANDTPYGLTAAVYTNDPARQRAASQRLRVGGLAINRRSDYAELEAPFGGAKDSGHGAPDGGEYVYASVCELQAVYAA
jgi:acyl-CoA reductase-like NAD-dependent aldehyde dehydrogenase